MQTEHRDEQAAPAGHQQERHRHHHDARHTKRMLDRMARIEGHVRGISNMIREDRPCPEVLLQLSAVRAALGQVARHILKEHLSDCVLHAAERGAAEQELQALHRALDQFIE